jgi:hypothetical protein
MSGRTPPVIGGPSRTDSAVLPVLEPHASLVRTAGGGRGQYPTRRARILAVDSNTDFENKPSR